MANSGKTPSMFQGESVSVDLMDAADKLKPLILNLKNSRN